MHTVMEIIRLISRAAVTAERWLFTSPSACVSAVMRETVTGIPLTAIAANSENTEKHIW